jgi:hypothetical protein
MLQLYLLYAGEQAVVYDRRNIVIAILALHSIAFRLGRVN